MTERTEDVVAPDTVEQIAEVHDHLAAIVRDVPGPLRRIRVATAEVEAEVEWTTVEPVTVAVAAPASPPGTVDLTPVADATPADTIDAPLVGTFYTAPSPGAAPFVQPGMRVSAGQHVAIIEAMKLMNFVDAPTDGVVTEILVGNGDAVEFDQPLMVCEPDRV